jgi:uncharacterized protein with von Willebrand factor type A (vWA) domain
MTVDSLVSELTKFPKDYEVILVGDRTVPEREIIVIVSHKEKFLIVKYTSFNDE